MFPFYLNAKFSSNKTTERKKCRILPHKQKNDIDFERKLYYNKVQKNYEKTLCLLFDTDSAQNLKEAKKCFTMQF